MSSLAFMLLNPADLSASLVYSLIGIVIFMLTFIIVDKITPYDLWKELVEKKNTALAIVVAGLAIGICIIIAASIH
jgi:putative membrane protein